MREYCANWSESNLQMRTECNMQREPLVNTADWKKTTHGTDREELQNAKQNHVLAASSREELQVTISSFYTVIPAMTS